MPSRALFTSTAQNWKTPRAFYQALDAEFGFDFDPCPTKRTFDGLTVSWGNTTFCNPPYNELGVWIRKAYAEWQKQKTVVLLIPARTDTNAWHDCILKSSEIRFVRGRLKFNDGKRPATFPSAVVVFRKRDARK